MTEHVFRGDHFIVLCRWLNTERNAMTAAWIDEHGSEIVIYFNKLFMGCMVSPAQQPGSLNHTARKFTCFLLRGAVLTAEETIRRFTFSI